jgi:hypothetical protein
MPGMLWVSRPDFRAVTESRAKEVLGCILSVLACKLGT